MPSGPRIRANNVYGIISNNPLTAVATTYNSISLPLLPVVVSAHAIVVLDPKRVYGDPEIIAVTTHTAASTVATITRGLYGTSARLHPVGTAWAHVPIDEDWSEILTSTTRPLDPYRGQMIFEYDTNKFVARSITDAWVDVVPLGAWQTWSPQLFQNTQVTATTTRAVYTKIGRTIIAMCDLQPTAVGTSGQRIEIRNLPVSPVATYSAIGSFRYFDSGTTIYSGTAANEFGLSIISFYVTGNGNPMGINPTFAIAVADNIQMMITYEAVS